MNRVSRIAVLTLAAVLTSVAAVGQHYVQTNLVSDVPGVAINTDPLLVNAWGMSHTASSPIWVSDTRASAVPWPNDCMNAAPRLP